jgi:hypothetical protein
MDELSVFERFISLAKRELLADDVRLLAHGEVAPEANNVVVARLPDGRHVVASFSAEPDNRDALARRLGMLAGTFADALANPPSERTRARAPVPSTLHEELKAVAFRAGARDVVVIDGESPVLWACASVPAKPRLRPDFVLREVSEPALAAKVEESGVLQDLVPPAESSPMASNDDAEDEDEPEITRRVIVAIRRLPELAQLPKGRHVRHVSQGEPAYLVLSFSSIYLLCLVFEGEFDELRAERAAHESLPRIERLVLALPPLDPGPEPMGGVVTLRRRRR